MNSLESQELMARMLSGKSPPADIGFKRALPIYKKKQAEQERKKFKRFSFLKTIRRIIKKVSISSW